MELSELQERALGVRQRLESFEIAEYGAAWTTADLVSGLVTDVGDLAAAIQRHEGRRLVGRADPIEEIRHELGDCLWVLLVLADRFDIGLADAATSTMDDIDTWLAASSPPDGG